MKLLHIVLNDLTRDSRVLRACELGHEVGFDVQVFSLCSVGLPIVETHRAYLVRRFPVFSWGGGRNFFFLLVKYFESFLRMVFYGIRDRPDIVHVHDLNAVMTGFMIAKLSGAKLIYDSHELWSGSSSIIKFPPIVKKPVLYMQRLLARCADVNITVGEQIARDLEKEFGVDKVHVVRNIPELKRGEQRDVFRETFNVSTDKTIILYQGAVAAGRGVETLIQAMPLIYNKGVLVFLGDGHIKDKLRLQVEDMGLSGRVFFHDPVDPSVLLDYTGSADIGVAPIEPICRSYELCLPNKLFEYIHAGLATIVSELPEMSNLVKIYGVGTTFKNNDPESLAEAINFYLDNPVKLAEAKRNSNEAAKELNWQKESSVLADIYRGLMG